MSRIVAVAFLSAAALASAPASAQSAPPDDANPRDDIIVYGRAIEQVGIASTATEGTVGYADFENRPIARVGELAENVPGLIATQHSGTGKANQYFLRGFNLDHGTDLAASVDGVPVNARSHGHGQGYLDLNFLIPELVERIDYAKGPYHAEQGDFASAGSLSFVTRDTIRPFVELVGGSFDYYRGLAAGSAEVGADTNLLAAIDITTSNGPWVLDEDLTRINGFAKLSGPTWSLSASAYDATWTSTDQVPERAIASGLIPRLGFLDDDLGGQASRYALTGQARFGDVSATLYAVRSRLTLTSNFTYFLDDPDNGDEFRQRDSRHIYGGSLRYNHDTTLATTPLTLRAGLDARYDDIDRVGLYRSVDGAIASAVREDSIDQYSGALFVEAEAALSPSLRLILGLRGDAFGYDVAADLAVNSGDGSDGIVTPKASLAWLAADGVELYASYGQGFHSNDVRGATIVIDPASGDPADRVPVFARSHGAELGLRVERGPLNLTAAAFWLNLESELVYVGDAGTTEPNDATRRYGIESTIFWRPVAGVTLDASAAYTRARFRGVAAGLSRIPGAVPLVFGGGVTAEVFDDVTATLRLRHFGSAPLIEDGSARSEATTLVNGGLYWQPGRFRVGVELLNLFDADDADISYFYASRLPGEPDEGVEDRHIHPVEPRQVRVSVRMGF